MTDIGEWVGEKSCRTTFTWKNGSHLNQRNYFLDNGMFRMGDLCYPWKQKL